MLKLSNLKLRNSNTENKIKLPPLFSVSETSQKTQKVSDIVITNSNKELFCINQLSKLNFGGSSPSLSLKIEVSLPFI